MTLSSSLEVVEPVDDARQANDSRQCDGSGQRQPPTYVIKDLNLGFSVGRVI